MGQGSDVLVRSMRDDSCDKTREHGCLLPSETPVLGIVLGSCVSTCDDLGGGPGFGVASSGEVSKQIASGHSTSNRSCDHSCRPCERAKACASDST